MNCGGARCRLEALEDRLHRVALEAQGALHPPGVDGARGHPFLDGDVAHGVAAEGGDQVGHAGPVDEMTGEEVLGHEDGEARPSSGLPGQ